MGQGLMDLYSAALSLALAGAGAAVLAALWSGLETRPARAAARVRWRRAARIGSLASLALVTFSLVYHLATGHRPGTPESMRWLQLVPEHPSFLVIALLAVAVLCWLRRTAD